MIYLAYFVLALYSLALLYISWYCVMQLNLLYHYKRSGNKVLALTSFVEDASQENEEKWPMVTVQLPMYNELYVVERLIDSIAAFDYPKDRFEIQILDDSTDETTRLAAKKAEEYRAQGFRIEHIRRENREGFKAGALQYGMQFAKGEFIAIFDADFLPRPDFLKRTIPYFKNPETGVVQTRWEHINEDYSFITQLQAMQLNVHFTVEQGGRQAGKFLLQFNGTAGVWRRKTIEDAGGWEADTLTEDLDLSIRAQLKGWKIVFLEEVGSPAELPAEMNGLKSQQYRWMKGGAETAKKMLPTVWRAPQLSLWQKMHATMHLLASSIFVFVFLVGVLSVPLLFFMDSLKLQLDFLKWFLFGWMVVIVVYYVANVQLDLKHGGSYLKRLLKFIVLFPVFLALSMGLSLHNSIAVLQGFWGRRTPFVRTPKYNLKDKKDTFARKGYRLGNINWTTLLEGVLALYFTLAVWYSFVLHNSAFRF
ncbi:MAG TPA: glycosyltransferase, partial [Phaeodactylibacter sp.]|nr:glycosyltransferase [Phaeodactylibacter sp.]